MKRKLIGYCTECDKLRSDKRGSGPTELVRVTRDKTRLLLPVGICVYHAEHPLDLLPVTSEDMIALHELIDEVRDQVRQFAEAHGTHGSWGAVRSLE